MAVTLGQQYHVGEKPTIILYTYINSHAGTRSKMCIQIFFEEKIPMFPRASLSCQIVWDKSGGRIYRMAFASTSTTVVHQGMVRTEYLCEPSPGGITVS